MPDHNEAMRLADEQSPWICPWSICNHEQAQACRASKETTKMRRGCGTYFAPGTTSEEARWLIGLDAARTTHKETE